MIDQIRKVVDAIQIKRHEVPLSRAIMVGITGIDGCGKSYVTGLVVPECQKQGFKAIGINVDSWLNLPHKRFSKSHPAEYFYEHAIRFDEIFQQLALPLKHKRQHSVSADLAEETASEYHQYTYRFENVDVLVLEGIYLLKSAYRNYFDLTVWIDCTFETALERALKRSQEGLVAAETVRAYQTIYFPAQQIHFANDHPRDAADLVIQNDPRLDGGTSGAAVDQFRQLKPYLFEGERP